MANLKSSLKDIRRIAKRNARNRSARSRLNTLRRRLGEATEGADRETVRRAAQEYISALDRAAKCRIVHRNKADRHKSRYAQLLSAK